jgi:heptosyltransferase-2
VINSSGAWGAAKIWPANHVEQLARRLVENHPYQVLLHCGPAERAAANEVAQRIGHQRAQSMGRVDQLPLALTKAVIAQAAVVVSTDSGPRHIAVALDRPVIGLFGPTDPAWTTTYNRPETALGVKNLACRGCWQKSCPLGHNRCMRDLGVETVYGAVVQAMHQGQRSRAA